MKDRFRTDAFRTRLLHWYQNHQRPLPWKAEKDPYRIWLSEIILQQTRVVQGLSYYQRFVERFPDVHHLAAASLDEVLKCWEGLGYYSRARNLHRAAQWIVRERDGFFPAAYEDILSLPGVGPYTAAAIASFAFGLPYPVLDGNVFRVLARFFGDATPVDSAAARALFTRMAGSVLDREHPGAFNQAIMDFGADLCKPAGPHCDSCPLSDLCIAFQEGKVHLLPVKAKKIAPRVRYFHYLLCGSERDWFIRQRNGKDIWQYLWEFPLIEADRKLSAAELTDTPEWKSWFGSDPAKVVSVTEPIQQTLTHQKIIAGFYRIELPVGWTEPVGAEWRKMAHQNSENCAFPRIITLFLANKSVSLSLF